MYEARQHPPIAFPAFVLRVARHALVASGVLAFSLLIGMAGYIRFESLGWMDSFLNASMLLGGMGPVDAPHTQLGKLFAGCYALYAGLVFLVAASLLVAPVAHRLLHKFHWEEDTQ